MSYPSWIETANADNGLATAQRAAGRAHYVTGISASYSKSDSGLLTLKQGDTELARWEVYNAFALVFPSPVRIEPGNLAELELAASGTDETIGAVVMTGHTV